jgi:catechol 2,3-dioxygenase-like lactoylglutathione lyase family enzyme
MTVPLKNVGAITLFAEDLAGTAAFYRDVLGLSAVSEDEESVAFDFGNTLINVLVSSSASELIGPAPVGDRVAGSRFQLTVWVDDVDAVCAQLKKHGVALLSGPVDRPWGHRTAAFTDPAGHVWEVAQPLGT